MYTFFVVLILIASVILVLSVLSQNPKSGMAANFGASNQVMGVRQTADFLEKLTWGMAISIVVLSLAATMVIPKSRIAASSDGVDKAILQKQETNQMLLQDPARLPLTQPAEGEQPAQSAE